MERALDQPTVWILETSSHPEMQCALRKILKSVTAILENEAADGDPTAMGVLQQLRKPFLPCAFSLTTMKHIREDVYFGGNVICLNGNYSEDESRNFETKEKSYLSKLIDNIQTRFPHVHLVSLMGNLLPQNSAKATPNAVMELAREFDVDKSMFWNEFQS